MFPPFNASAWTPSTVSSCFLQASLRAPLATNRTHRFHPWNSHEYLHLQCFCEFVLQIIIISSCVFDVWSTRGESMTNRLLVFPTLWTGVRHNSTRLVGAFRIFCWLNWIPPFSLHHFNIRIASGKSTLLCFSDCGYYFLLPFFPFFQALNQISLLANLFFINIHSREPMAALSLSKAQLYAWMCSAIFH